MNPSCLTLTLGVFISLAPCAQDRFRFPIKEQFDYADEYFIDGDIHPCWMSSTINYPGNDIALANEIEQTYANGMAHVLRSYVQMYKATGDLAYLFRFVDRAICMRENRWDALGIEQNLFYTMHDYEFDQPHWAKHDPGGDGNIIAAMAQFAYLVQIEKPELMSVVIPQFEDTHIAQSELGPWTTLDDFTDDLVTWINETMNIYAWTPGYWINDTYCFSASPSPPEEAQYTTFINLQGPMGAALYYLGQLNTSDWYTHWAAAIAARYNSLVYDQVDCYWEPFHWTNSNTSLRDVTEFDNGASRWRYVGWAPKICGGDNDNDFDYEDISHAITTLLTPRTVHHVALENTDLDDVVYFGDTEMLRYRNTFTQNIYAGLDDVECPIFHSAVDGDDVIDYRGADKGYDYDGLGTLNTRALAYMWLSEFDYLGDAPNVYDILMDFYARRYRSYDEPVTEYVELYGLADAVTAQWERECFDLTLFNRKLNYDQNFAAKHDLTIDPNGGFGRSFADPIITTPDFEIESAVTSELRAGNSIHLLPGFHAIQGCDLHAAIDPAACDMEYRLASQANPIAVNERPTSRGSGSEATSKGTRRNSSSSAGLLRICPNPGQGLYTMVPPPLRSDANYVLTVFDQTGHPVERYPLQNSREAIQIDIRDGAAGVYHLELSNGQDRYAATILFE